MENVAELKTGLHQVIAETDDLDTLTKIKRYISGLIDEEQKIIANTHENKPLNQINYKADVDSAIQEAKEGKVISVDEL